MEEKIAYLVLALGLTYEEIAILPPAEIDWLYRNLLK